MRLSDMIEAVTNNAYKKVCESGIVLNDDEKTAVAKSVGVAAMKVGDLVNHRTKDYVFDMERFLGAEGKTGPYLQYTAVRIKSVLEKARLAEMQFGPILTPSSGTERELMLSLNSVPDALLRAFEEKAPYVICETLFSIAGVFNRFYFENKVLICPDADRRASWLTLFELTYKMLGQLLDILGIDVPERM